jgi:hypothetical protein|eukprot:COSAG03_NODE_390_length_8302_cov_70.582317_2_plen_35_part_00
MQYVTAASCEGGKRDIRFIPLAEVDSKTKARAML